MRWSRREVRGVYFASGPPPCCHRVFFQGCSPLSRHPASRKFCRKWFTATTPTLRGSRSRTSFSMSVFTRSMRICISFASIDVFFYRFLCYYEKKHYFCSISFWSSDRNGMRVVVMAAPNGTRLLRGLNTAPDCSSGGKGLGLFHFMLSAIFLLSEIPCSKYSPQFIW